MLLRNCEHRMPVSRPRERMAKALRARARSLPVPSRAASRSRVNQYFLASVPPRLHAPGRTYRFHLRRVVAHTGQV